MEEERLKEYGYCLRCGRRLYKQEAKELGYGKICYNKTRLESKHRTLFPIRKVFTNKS